MKTIDITMADLQKRLHQPWVVCYGIVETLYSAGLATRVGYHRGSTKAGRPSIVWRVPVNITFDLETGIVKAAG